MRASKIGIALLAATCAACVLGASAPAAEQEAAALAARTQKGVLVLQVGSDWCVSGENVRKVFESRAFEKAVGGKYVLAVYDEMESPTEAVKAKNALVKDILIRTKRFPALTCYAPGKPPRVFAQIENIPGNVTPEKLAYVVSRMTERKNQAEALFQKAASAKGDAAANLYGEGFDLLVPMMGTFHQNELKKGKAAWTKEWEELKKLDAGDRLGWVRHFNLDDYTCVELLAKGIRDKDSKLATSTRSGSWPRCSRGLSLRRRRGKSTRPSISGHLCCPATDCSRRRLRADGNSPRGMPAALTIPRATKVRSIRKRRSHHGRS